MVRNWISYKKVGEPIFLSSLPPWSRAKGARKFIFGSIEPYNECILPFQYNIIFQPYQSFEPPNSTTGEGGGCGSRHIRFRTFLYEIQLWTTFIWSFFGCDAYFWQPWALHWKYFAISVQYNFSTISIFQTPSSTLGGDRHMCSPTFLYEI